MGWKMNVPATEAEQDHAHRAIDVSVADGGVTLVERIIKQARLFGRQRRHEEAMFLQTALGDSLLRIEKRRRLEALEPTHAR